MSGSWDPSHFPNLTKDQHVVTSPYDRNYNCIAFAADDKEKWWWPNSRDDYWPPEAPNNVTMDVFIIAFGTLGYVECKNGNLEEGFEKVALFAKDDRGQLIPTHMAKQLPDGRWKSKLGRLEDIEHDALSGVDGPPYGKAYRFMKRLLSANDKDRKVTDVGDVEADVEEASPQSDVENPNAREDFNSLLGAAARKPKRDD